MIEGNGYGADEGFQDTALNGLSLGPANEPTQRYYRLPRTWLRETNAILLFEEQSVCPASLQIETRL